MLHHRDGRIPTNERLQCHHCVIPSFFDTPDSLKCHLEQIHGQSSYQEYPGYFSPPQSSSSVSVHNMMQPFEQVHLLPQPSLQETSMWSPNSSQHAVNVSHGVPNHGGPMMSPSVQIEPYFAPAQPIVMQHNPSSFQQNPPPPPLTIPPQQSNDWHSMQQLPSSISANGSCLDMSSHWKCNDCNFESLFRGNMIRHCSSYNHHFADTEGEQASQFSEMFNMSNVQPPMEQHQQVLSPPLGQSQIVTNLPQNQWSCPNAMTPPAMTSGTWSTEENLDQPTTTNSEVEQKNMVAATQQDDTDRPVTLGNQGQDLTQYTSEEQNPTLDMNDGLGSKPKRIRMTKKKQKQSVGPHERSGVHALDPELPDNWSPPFIIPSSPTGINTGMEECLASSTTTNNDSLVDDSFASTTQFVGQVSPEKSRMTEDIQGRDDLNHSFLEDVQEHDDESKASVMTTKVDDLGEFACTECDFTTEFRKSFKRHCFMHQNQANFKCKLCSFSVNQLFILKSHMKKHHITYKSMKTQEKVELPPMRLPKTVEVPTEAVMDPEIARHCPGTHVSFAYIREHFVDKLVEGTKCRVCQARFQEKSLYNFREHVYAKHLLLKPNVCKFCPYSSSYKTSVKRHQDKCGAKPQKDVIVNDEADFLIKKDVRAMKFCSFCNFKTKNSDSLKKHMLTHDTSPQNSIDEIKTEAIQIKDDNDTEDDEDVPLNDLKVMQGLQGAEHDTSEQADIVSVFIVKNSVTAESDDNWVDGFLRCQECEYKTKLKQEFDRHQKCHSMPNRHKCDLCSYSAIFPHLVRIHKHHHHKKSEKSEDSSKEVEKLSCKICSFKTPYEGLFKAHNVHHEEIHNYKCYICNFSSNQPHVTKRHERKDHSEEERGNVSGTSNHGKVTRQFQRQAQLQEQLKILDQKQQELQRNMTNETCYTSPVQESPSKKHNCQECNFKGTLEQELSRHMTHHNAASSTSKFHCNKCSFGCDTKNLIELHCDHHHHPPNEGYTEMNADTEDEISFFTCNDCLFTSENESAFKLHQSRHGAAWSWRCSRCNFAAPLESSILEHEKLHHDYISSECQDVNKCHLCDFVCELKGEMDKHNRNHLLAHPNKCPLCSYSVEAATDMLSHFKNDHEENQALSDADAMKRFNEQVRLTKLKTQTEPAPLISGTKRKRFRHKRFKCPHCMFSTDKRRRLQNHMSKHAQISGALKYLCSLCSYSGHKKFIIEQHIENYHDVPKESYDSYIVENSDSCGEKGQTAPVSLVEPGNLISPADQVGGSLAEKVTVPEGFRWHCDQCLFTTRFMEYVRTHQMRHFLSSRFQCKLCSYSATTRNQIKLHLSRHHIQSDGGIKNHIVRNEIVTDPQINFETEDKLMGGRLVPVGQKVKKPKAKYGCSKCDFIATGAGQQQRHFVCHVKKSLFTCGMCRYSVKTEQLLKKHKLKHHKQKVVATVNDDGMKAHRFPCHKCEFRAHRKDALQSHLQRHGSRSRFTCKYCDYSAFQLSFVTNHQEKFHVRLLGKGGTEKMEDTQAEVSLTTHAKTDSSSLLSGIHKPTSEGPLNVPSSQAKKYNCSECNYATNFTSNFKGHRARHLLDPTKSRGLIMCSLCSYCAQNQNALTKHLVHQHGVALEQHVDLENRLVQSSIPMTPDSSERSGSEASHILPIPLSSRANEDQFVVQQKLVASSYQYLEKTNAETVADCHGSILHHIPSTFADVTFPRVTSSLSSETNAEIECAKERVKASLQKNGAYLSAKAPPKNYVICRFCPCVCNSSNERTAHERSHGVRSGSAKVDMQYQCPLCSFSSDTDIDAHLGLHLRLAEFHDICGNVPSSPAGSVPDVGNSLLPVSEDSLDNASTASDDLVAGLKTESESVLDMDAKQRSACCQCEILVDEADMELHLLRHQLGSHYLFL